MNHTKDHSWHPWYKQGRKGKTFHPRDVIQRRHMKYIYGNPKRRK